MQAEHLVLDDSSQRKEIEELSELFPDVGITVFAKALIVEAIPIIKRNNFELII